MSGAEAATGLYRAASVRALERAAIDGAGLPGRELMERAGAAAFAALCARWPAARRLAVVTGAGNNGGDGYVLARLARDAGCEVRLLALAGPGQPGADAALAAAAWQAAGGGTSAFDQSALADCEVLVDAIFGTGLARPVEGEAARAIATMNASGRPVLAIDVPSGLAADTGAVLGTAVRAAVTVTFIGVKQGMVTGAGPALCGDIVFDDLGLPPALYDRHPPDARVLTDAERRAALAPRRRDGHKGDYGRVLVVGGGVGYAGAARMAAEAAARVGAGLVSLATRPEHAGLVAAARPEIMAHPVGQAAELGPLLCRAGVVAVGPGLAQGPWARALFAAVLDAGLPLVVDADALNLLAAEPCRREDWVLTPHPGEAARLLGSTSAAVQADRYAAVAALRQRYGGVVVLKGAGSLVADASGVAVCTAGNPGMGSGGMGDVLTGVVAGLAAQGLSLAEAARVGVRVHALAADAAAAEGGERGLLATDLLPGLRRLVNP